MNSRRSLMLDRTTSGQRAAGNSRKLARLESRGRQFLSQGLGGVPNTEHKENLGPRWGENRQGSMLRCHSQDISGVGPCLASAHSLSAASVGSQSLCRACGFHRRQKKIELNGIEHKDDNPIRSLLRLYNLRLSVAQRSGRPNTGSDV